MTTVVVVRKAGQVVIAADTLVTFGDTRLANRFERNAKIFRVDTDEGPSYVGMSGTVAHFPVLRRALTAMPREALKLHTKDAVFDTFTMLHPKLKEHFFLQTKEEDNDPYESSQFSVLIANARIQIAGGEALAGARDRPQAPRQRPGNQPGEQQGGRDRDQGSQEANREERRPESTHLRAAQVELHRAVVKPDRLGLADRACAITQRQHHLGGALPIDLTVALAVGLLSQRRRTRSQHHSGLAG